MGTMLNINGLHYQYPGSESGIRGIDFKLGRGEKHGIIGANGAGKSTLLQLITGIIKADRGDIEILDTPLNRKSLQELRGKTGLLFQSSDDQLFSLTIRDDVCFGPRNMGLTPEEVDRRTEEALIETGIPHLADRAPHTLSGGEKKSAALASILSMDPELLLLDEPTAGLDPRSRRSLSGILNRLDHSMMIVSHDLDFILDSCSKVSILHEGRIVITGDAEEILTDRILLEEFGLELPLQFQRCDACRSNTMPSNGNARDGK